MIDLVVGCGEIGGPLADILEMSGPVYRIDKDLNRGRSSASHADVMHVCLPFNPLDPNQFIDTTTEYARLLFPDYIFIHSTVTPGTTRAIHAKLKAYQKTFYSPVRGRHSEMHRDMMRYRKFVSAVHYNDIDVGAALLEDRLFRVETIEQPETLELAKLFETTYSGLLIAWAQEMETIAAGVGADREEALRFTSEIEYLPDFIFQPGKIGGHCIMPNIEILAQLTSGQSLPLCQAIKRLNQDDSGNQWRSTKRLQPKRLGQ